MASTAIWNVHDCTTYEVNAKATWVLAHDAASADAVTVFHHRTDTRWSRSEGTFNCWRGILRFDASVITAGKVITRATLLFTDVELAADPTSLYLVSAPTVDMSDASYGVIGAATVNRISSYVVNGSIVTYELNAGGIADILIGTGAANTIWGLRNDNDALNIAPTEGQAELNYLPIDATLYTYPLLTVYYDDALTVRTDAATLITGSGATLNGNLVNDGGYTDGVYCNFQYGLTTAYGSTTGAEVKLEGQSFAHAITGLLPGTIYHFRAKAFNVFETQYGLDRTFTTSGGVYPTDPLTRVSALVHHFSAGPSPVYQLEVMLGGLSSQYVPPLENKIPEPTMPAPQAPQPAYDPYTIKVFGVWLSQHTASQLFSFFGHGAPYDYNEWRRLMVTGGGGGFFGPGF